MIIKRLPSIEKLLRESESNNKIRILKNNKHILYSEISNKPKTYNNKYCYITVKLPFFNNKSYFISNYFDIKPGNVVLLYIGKNNNRNITKVIEVNFYNEEEVPFPLSKTKLVKQVFDSETNIEDINELIETDEYLEQVISNVKQITH